MAVLVALLAFASALDAGAPPADRRTPVLVELFTSEGCSSCPPADAVLRRLADEQPVPTARIIALGEHVDYWDDLGWRDPFSSRTFSERQDTYERCLGVMAPYTPQLVVDGQAQLVGGDFDGARRAVAAAARTAQGSLTAAVVSRSPKDLRVRVNASWSTGVRADVLVALVQGRGGSTVAHGENAGRSLSHVAIARTLRRVGSGDGTFASTATLAMAPGVTSVVAFVQDRRGRILAVNSIDLAP